MGYTTEAEGEKLKLLSKFIEATQSVITDEQNLMKLTLITLAWEFTKDINAINDEKESTILRTDEDQCRRNRNMSAKNHYLTKE